MKKILMLINLTGLLVSNLIQAEKKVYLLNITSGESPSPKLVEKSDLSLSDQFVADFNIVEEKMGDRTKWLKVVFSKGKEENAPYGKCKFGINKPKINNWDDWEIIKFEVYNPQNFPVKVDFIVREGKFPFSYAERFDTPLVIPPGKSIQKIYIQGATNNNNDPFNLKDIYEWYIGVHNLKEEPIILYFGDIELSCE